MTASYYLPTDDVGKADLLGLLFSFHPALRGEKKILWTKGKASALEIWVDRNEGNGFVFLIIHTEPKTTEPVWY